MMSKMGFSDKWVKWMALCIESVNYFVLVNGESVGRITLGRGLRQGNPLSPYLFLICAEGLTTLLKNAEARGDVHGIKVCRGAPALLHLLLLTIVFFFQGK